MNADATGTARMRNGRAGNGRRRRLVHRKASPEEMAAGSQNGKAPADVREGKLPSKYDERNYQIYLADECDKARARRDSKRMLAAQDQAPRQLPAFLPVGEIPRTRLQHRIDPLWPSGGNVLFSAYMKVGKSTLLRNGIRSLLTGDDFLGEYTTRPVSGSIVVADIEMTRSVALERLDAHGLGQQEKLRYEFLRGRGQDFNVLDDEWLGQLARGLRDLDTEILVIDTINALASSLGVNLDAPDGAGPLVARLEEVKLQAGISEMLLTAQTGHGDRTRHAHSKDLGASADMLWNLQLTKDGDPDGPRKFVAHGRAEGTNGWQTLGFDRKTDTVTVDATTLPDNAKTKILLVMTGGAEMSADEIEKQSGYKRAMVNRTLDEMEKKRSAIKVSDARGNKPAVWKLT